MTLSVWLVYQLHQLKQFWRIIWASEESNFVWCQKWSIFSKRNLVPNMTFILREVFPKKSTHIHLTQPRVTFWLYHKFRNPLRRIRFEFAEKIQCELLCALKVIFGFFFVMLPEIEKTMALLFEIMPEKSNLLFRKRWTNYKFWIFFFGSCENHLKLEISILQKIQVIFLGLEFKSIQHLYLTFHDYYIYTILLIYKI